MNNNNEMLNQVEAAAAWLRQIEHDRVEATERLDRAITALRAIDTTWSAINHAAKMTNVQVSYERRQSRRRMYGRLD